jgi:hypothetical protein
MNPAHTDRELLRVSRLKNTPRQPPESIFWEDTIQHPRPRACADRVDA